MMITVENSDAFVFCGGRDYDPAKETVVFVHGAGLNHTVWTLPTRYFIRHGFNVLSVDLPGHGRSAGALKPSIPDMADWIIAVLDAMGTQRAALVGHSMGSLVTLEAAARHPDRVRSIALLGTALPMPVTDELLASAKANDHSAIDMLTLWGYSKAAQIGGNDTPGMWMVGGTMRLFEQAAPGVLFNDLNACNEYTHGLESAAKVTCPTLMIVGTRDIMTPMFRAKDVDAALADSTMLVLPGSGHTMMSEKPDEVLDALITIV